LPDVIGQLLSRVTEHEVYGAEFLGLRDIHGLLYQATNRGFDLGSQLVHDGFDALLASFRRRGSSGPCRHG
jgi:hypothetical protein